jgi:hypothetical protein
MASMELASPQAGRTRPRNTRWLIFLATIGPGLTVMLADTDAGSVITAAHMSMASGVQFFRDSGCKSSAQLERIMIPWQHLVMPWQHLVYRGGPLSR